MDKTPRKQNNSDVWRYASLGSQLLASLGIAVFIGYKADKWTGIAIPLLIWLLPLLVLIVMIYKLIRETSQKK